MRRSSVVSMAFLAAILTAGCAQRPDDKGIVTNIKSQMFSSAQLKNSDLQVTSSKGEVSLSGTVGNDSARLEAYKLATHTPGVVKVNDQMTVEAAQTYAADNQLPAASSPVPTPAARSSRAKNEKKKARGFNRRPFSRKTRPRISQGGSSCVRFRTHPPVSERPSSQSPPHPLSQTLAKTRISRAVIWLRTCIQFSG